MVQAETQGPTISTLYILGGEIGPSRLIQAEKAAVIVGDRNGRRICG